MPYFKKPHGETFKPVPQAQDGITGISEVIGLGKTGMEGAVAEREKLLASLEAQYKEVQDKLDGLYALTLHMGTKIGQLEGEFKASENLQKIIDVIKCPETAAYAKHGQIVLLLATNLRKWVIVNESKFKWPGDIKTGLKYLIEDLGGLA
jgi:hypothetical protein